MACRTHDLFKGTDLSAMAAKGKVGGYARAALDCPNGLTSKALTGVTKPANLQNPGGSFFDYFTSSFQATDQYCTVIWQTCNPGGFMQGRTAKGKLVEAGIPIYMAAAEVELNPGALGRFLNSTKPLPQRLEDRLNEVIERSKEPAGANA